MLRRPPRPHDGSACAALPVPCTTPPRRPAPTLHAPGALGMRMASRSSVTSAASAAPPSRAATLT